MKIFRFDPSKGRKGELIGRRQLATWTTMSVRHGVETGLIRPINHRLPVPAKNESWTTVMDAGSGGPDGQISYRHQDKWVCFCLGELVAGQGKGVWTWVVLPPDCLIHYQATSVHD